MINEKELVVIGGRCKENVLKEVLIINIENGKVEKLCELEEELCAHSSVMVDENRIVVIGGFNKNGFSKNLYRIDIKER